MTVLQPLLVHFHATAALDAEMARLLDHGCMSDRMIGSKLSRSCQCSCISRPQTDSANACMLYGGTARSVPGNEL